MDQPSNRDEARTSNEARLGAERTDTKQDDAGSGVSNGEQLDAGTGDTERLDANNEAGNGQVQNGEVRSDWAWNRRAGDSRKRNR